MKASVDNDDCPFPPPPTPRTATELLIRLWVHEVKSDFYGSIVGIIPNDGADLVLIEEFNGFPLYRLVPLAELTRDDEWTLCDSVQRLYELTDSAPA